MPTWLDQLDDAQRRAVTHGGGPLLVVAGAGTGKTRTLASRVAHLVDGGVPPERILLLTFTRRAARQMLDRAAGLVEADVPGRVWGGTFHAVGNRLLRLYGRALGLAPSFTVLDQADAADLMDLVRGELGLGRGDRRFPRKDTLVAMYSRTVNAGEPLGDVLERRFPWCAEEAEGIGWLFRAYTGRKRERGTLDYDDLLLYWRALMATGVGDRVGALFDHVLVDEYQDTNALQADVLVAMRRGCPNVTAVGDDAQAIYGFRAASVENILGFGVRFPGTTVVTLERNHRSVQRVLDAANAVTAGAARSYPKRLWSDRGPGALPTLETCLDEVDQSDAVCRRILEHRESGIPLARQAVLFRAAHHSDLLEVELSRRNIPFVKYGGLRFVEAAHVKDLLTFLRLLENDRDEVAWFRLLQLLDGVGPVMARATIAELGVAASGPDTGSPLRRFVEHPPVLPPAAEGDAAGLREAFADLLDAGLPVAAEVERIRRAYGPIARRRYGNADARLRDLEQLNRLAAAAPSRERFLSDLALDPPASTGELAGPPLLDEDYLILSTIHSAKGCEWDAVHVIHAADGNIPSDLATGNQDEVEEERRLFYVALTRARDALHVYVPLRYYHRKHQRGDGHSYAQVTRFLPPPVRALFEETSTVSDDGTPGTPSFVPGPEPVGAATVDAFLDALWGEAPD